jgi:hypothetical protein
MVRQFEAWLRLSVPVDVALQIVWTQNRSTLLSFRRSPKAVKLRLHQHFCRGGPAVADAIAGYMIGRTPKRHPALGQFIAEMHLHLQAHHADRAARPQILRPQGHHHDLTALWVKLNAAYFHSGCTAQITWGRSAPPSRRRRSMVLGSYAQGQNLIRMHPALDQSFVPSYVVCGVIYHEMLHEVFGVPQGPGRRRLHPPEFVAIEQAYPDYQRCRAWEQANIGRLLAYRP